jgi:hypothetical protein
MFYLCLTETKAIKNPTEVGLYLNSDCLFVRWSRDIALLNPSLELWVVFSASQTALAIIVNASIDDLTIHVG